MRLQRSAPRWAYPRSRGATASSKSAAPLTTGLSPLARGNPSRRGRRHHRQGPIPARAGQPLSYWHRARKTGAYPRSRGATELMPLVEVGLSPLARGNPIAQPQFFQGRGPIPARAGQPIVNSYRPQPAGAYPRSRGATYFGIEVAPGKVGLSPLARGNPGFNRRGKVWAGPIPARAGQPCP